MVSQPMVSIIMPTYNAQATIKESIASVTAQTYPHWELIVVDDASRDNTPEIVRALAKDNPRIRLHTNPQNAGVALSRNAGMAHAHGEWLAFLDSDDFWHEDKLQKQLQFMETQNAAISYTGTSYINDAGQLSDYVLRAEPELTYKDLLRRNIMSCSSVMVRRECMVPFSPGEAHEDYAAWMQILQKTDCAYGLDEPLLVYRMTKKSKSAKRLLSAKMTYHAYRKAQIGRLGAAAYTVRYAAHSLTKRRMVAMGWA